MRNSLHAPLLVDEIRRETFDIESYLTDLALGGTVVHGFFNCNRMSEDNREEEPPRDFKSNQVVLVYATRYGKTSRSADSTNNYINHLSKQIDGKCLSVPAAFQMFKGYGDMDCV